MVRSSAICGVRTFANAAKVEVAVLPKTRVTYHAKAVYGRIESAQAMLQTGILIPMGLPIDMVPKGA